MEILFYIFGGLMALTAIALLIELLEELSEGVMTFIVVSGILGILMYWDYWH
jgi:hypothetical protein